METQRLTPRRNSYNLAPSLTLKTRMTVPFSLAVAIRLPELLKANAASGESCAGIIVFACCNHIWKQHHYSGQYTIRYITQVYSPNEWHQIFALLQQSWNRDKQGSSHRLRRTESTGLTGSVEYPLSYAALSCPECYGYRDFLPSILLTSKIFRTNPNFSTDFIMKKNVQ